MVFVKIILATLMVFVISQHSWCLWRSPVFGISQHSWCLWRSPVFVISQHSWCLWRSLTIIAPSPLGSSGRSGQLLCPLSCLARCSCTCWCAWLVTLLGSLLLHLLICLARYSAWIVALVLLPLAWALLPRARALCGLHWCLWSRNTHGVYEDLLSSSIWYWQFPHWCTHGVCEDNSRNTHGVLISQHSWCLWRSPVQLDLILTIPAPSPLNWK